MNKLLSSKRAFLFDFDGTLTHSEIDFEALRTISLKMATDEGFSVDELNGNDILGFIYQVRDTLGGEKGEAYQRKAFEKLESLENTFCKNAKPIKGSIELCQELRHTGKKIAIVTRNSRTVVNGLLTSLGYQYDVLVARDDVRYVKPNPEHLHKALELLDTKPEDAVMIGDHPMDIEAGKACGCATVAFTTENKQSLFSKSIPDIYISSLADL